MLAPGALERVSKRLGVESRTHHHVERRQRLSGAALLCGKQATMWIRLGNNTKPNRLSMERTKQDQTPRSLPSPYHSSDANGCGNDQVVVMSSWQ
jgi:hypothetical protein